MFPGLFSLSIYNGLMQSEDEINKAIEQCQYTENCKKRGWENEV